MAMVGVCRWLGTGVNARPTSGALTAVGHKRASVRGARQPFFQLSVRHGPAARLQDRRPASEKNLQGTQASPYRPLSAFPVPATPKKRTDAA